MEQVTQLLSNLAQQLGTTVEYLWPLLVAYTRWQNIGYLVVDVIVFVTAIILITRTVPIFFQHYYLYHHRSDEKYFGYFTHALWAIAIAIASVVLLITAWIMLTNIPDTVAAIAVPEAKAIMNLLAQLKATTK